MFNNYKPLPCRKAERALKNLGFTEKKKTGSSHRQFEKIVNGHKFKVTLDCHKGEVSAKNVKSMAAQAGVTVKKFHEAI